MRRRAPIPLMVLALLVSACAGEIERVPGPQAPPPPPPGALGAETSPPATTTAAATTPLPVPRPALADLQRQAVENIVAAFNAHDAKKLASLYSDSALVGSPGATGWTVEKGRAAVEEGHTRLFGALPDLKWGSAHVYVKGKVVIQDWVSNATRKATPGDGKSVDRPTGMHGISVYWFDDAGLIEKDSTYFDSATSARQAGAMPGASRAVPPLPAGEPQIVTASGSPEESRREGAARAMYAAFAGKDEKAFLATLDKDVVQTAYAQPDDKKGHKAAAEDYRAMHTAFPDLQITLTNVWGFADRVVAEVTMTGTHAGPLGPLKPTKKVVTLHLLDVLALGKDDKITAMESYGDTRELLGQIGAPGEVKKKAAPKP